MKVATFLRHEQLIPGVWQSFFSPLGPLSYVPGQYLDIRLPGVNGDPRGNGRTFTLTSLPADEHISIIYRYDEPASPYKQRLMSLHANEEVQLGDALGDLVLPKSPSQPLIFVAGGIGMASFVGPLRQAQSEPTHRQIQLFYSLRHAYDDAFKELLRAYPLTSLQRNISPDYLKPAAIQQAATPDSLIYLSGSERFVMGLRDSLRALGLTDNQVVFDFFDGYADL